ncbi:MAG: HNH endonuclease [bacterium]
MRAWIGVTDPVWFEFLRSEPTVEEVNFWKPSSETAFRAIQPGELFLFKKDSSVVGGGFFGHAAMGVPCSIAWRTFGRLNGAPDLISLKERIARHRTDGHIGPQDYRIGCRILLKPFFLADSEFIDWPWGRNYGPGFTKDLSDEVGMALLDRLRPHLNAHAVELRDDHAHLLGADGPPRYGTPFLTCARLGQGAFRMLIADTYNRRCAVSREKTLPALEAAHILPVADGGSYTVTNGILMRADLHTLFDAGYVTITPDYNFKVSPKIAEEFQNGKVYYEMDNRPKGLCTFVM